jgi:hypothetical protein
MKQTKEPIEKVFNSKDLNIAYAKGKQEAQAEMNENALDNIEASNTMKKQTKEIVHIDGIPIRKDSMYYEAYSKGRKETLAEVEKSFGDLQDDIYSSFQQNIE